MPVNLRRDGVQGCSYEGQYLINADFSYADIRGIKFTNAILIGANFSYAKAGLQYRWAITLFICSLLLSILSGLISAYAASFIGKMLVNKDNLLGEHSFFVGAFILIVLAVFFVITINRGLGTAFGVLPVSAAIAIAVAAVGETGSAEAGIIVGTMALAGSVAGVVSLAGALALAGVLASTKAMVMAEIMMIVGSGLGALLGDEFDALFISVSVAVAVAILGAYVSKQALAGDEKQALIRKAAIAFAGIGGTSFHNADLTNADFTGSTLKSTDFRGSILIRTRWYQAKGLESARVGATYLEKPQVQQLLITGEGQDKNFDRLDLRGINLQGANLADASFVSTDLSQANLQDADLSRAKLVQTQLDKTDWTGSTLTGATIEDWGITSHTNLHKVRCKYVFMRVPTKDDPNPHRKPDNWKEEFEDDDFADFIKPIFDTLDLYHNQGVDPRAIAISFKQLAENHPEADLRIVGMEVRGENKFLLRAKTAATTDKSELSVEYFATYNEIKGLPEREIKLLLAEKDNQIRRLENMVMTALERPSFYAQNYQNQGDTMPQSPKKQSNFNLQGAQFGGGLVNADTVNAEQIGGDITNYGQQQQKEAQTETNNSLVKTILILAANPKNTSQLRLDEEVREIDAGLQRAKKRELFDLKQRWAVRVQDIYQSLLDFKPQIIHFSGHGAGEHGLVLEDDTGKLKSVDTEALAQLFDLFSSTIECVVLNACYSEVQAGAIAKHIPYVIGMNQEIADKAAIKFATGFYNALSAGESVEFAYKLGCNVIQLDGIPEHLTPVLKKKQ